MPYTSQGYMTAADLADHHELHDTGTVTVTVASLDLNAEQLADACPECGDALGEHDTVTVIRASGDITTCDR